MGKIWALAFVFIWLAFGSTPAWADLADDLEDLVGYTIATSKEISGWYDPGAAQVRILTVTAMAGLWFLMTKRHLPALIMAMIILFPLPL